MLRKSKIPNITIQSTNESPFAHQEADVPIDPDRLCARLWEVSRQRSASEAPLRRATHPLPTSAQQSSIRHVNPSSGPPTDPATAVDSQASTPGSDEGLTRQASFHRKREPRDVGSIIYSKNTDGEDKTIDTDEPIKEREDSSAPLREVEVETDNPTRGRTLNKDRLRRFKTKVQETFTFSHRFSLPSFPNWSLGKRRDDSRNPYERLGRSPTPYGKREHRRRASDFGISNSFGSNSRSASTVTAAAANATITNSPRPSISFSRPFSLDNNINTKVKTKTERKSSNNSSSESPKCASPTTSSNISPRTPSPLHHIRSKPAHSSHHHHHRRIISLTPTSPSTTSTTDTPPQLPPIPLVSVSKHTPATLLPSPTTSTANPSTKLSSNLRTCTTPPPPGEAPSRSPSSSSQQQQRGAQNNWFNSANTSPDSPSAIVSTGNLPATPTRGSRSGVREDRGSRNGQGGRSGSGSGNGNESGEWPLLGGPVTPESVLQLSAERRWRVRRGFLGRDSKGEREE